MAASSSAEITMSLGLRKRFWVDPALRMLCAVVASGTYLICRYGVVAEARTDAVR